LRRFLLPLYFRLSRRADAVVALTGGLAQDVVREAALPADRVWFIPNAVAPSRVPFRPREQPGRNDLGPHLVAVGRLTAQKGFERLIAGFALHASRGGAGRLTIAGEGPERKALAGALARHGLAGRVDLVGHVDDVSALLQTADLFVLSSHYEGLSNAMVEALVAGVPVLAATSETGASEFIREGVNGFLSTAENPQTLAGDMQRAVENLARLDRDAIREEALKVFSWDRYLSLYARALLGAKETPGALAEIEAAHGP
jgi:glycosyltransferase involved in cell wall biosynthesis